VAWCLAAADCAFPGETLRRFVCVSSLPPRSGSGDAPC